METGDAGRADISLEYSGWNCRLSELLIFLLGEHVHDPLKLARLRNP